MTECPLGKEIAQAENWVEWGVSDQRPKQPYSPDGYPTGPSDDHSGEWGTWDDVDPERAGFMFLNSRVAGVDIDDVEVVEGDDGPELSCVAEHGDNEACDVRLARELMDEMARDTYWERSPSGEGFHALFLTDEENWGHKGAHAEIYTSGRYFTVTGDEIEPASSGSVDEVPIDKLRGMVMEHQPEPTRGDVDIGIPDEAPEDMSECAHKLAETRASPSARRQYKATNGPFSVDTHLGQVLIANGYDKGEAVSVFKRWPKNGDAADFDPRKTERHLDKLYEKHEAGTLAPPSTAIEDAGLDISGCDCAVHGHRSYGAQDPPEQLSLPQIRSVAGPESNGAKTRARNDVRRDLAKPIETGLVYHAPQGTGKTRQAVRGARDNPRLILTANKGEHRDSVIKEAEEAGLTWDTVTPFAESWLANESPVANEITRLYEAGVQPKYITAEYGDMVPEDAYTPYVDQFEGEPSGADVLIGSPGHENVKRFRMCGVPGPEDPEPREVIHDDTQPGSRDVNGNAFTVDQVRAGVNELMQEIPELESDSWSQLKHNRDDRNRVKQLAIETGDTEPEERDVESVWDALEARADEPDAILVDLLDIVRSRDSVRGDTLIQLKVLAGAEIRGVHSFSWKSGGDEHFSWVQHPDLSEHEVAVLSATPVPHVVDKWLERCRAGPARHQSISVPWKEVRDDQGYTVAKLKPARNSRSGAGSYDSDTASRREAMIDEREDYLEAVARAEPGIDDPGEITPIDAKKLLENRDDEWVNFARVWSNNDMKDDDVGFVSGVTYYGDEWVKGHAAYVGRHTEILHEDGERAEATDSVGQALLDHMVRAPLEQAITRYGRSTPGQTTVYVLSDEIPTDFTAVDGTGWVQEITGTQADVVDAVSRGADHVTEIARRVDVTRQQVNNVVNQLDDMGILSRRDGILSHGRDKVSAAASVSVEDGSININTVELSTIPRVDRGRVGSEAARVAESAAGPADTAQMTLDFAVDGGDAAAEVPGAERDGGPPPGLQTDLDVFVE